MIRKTEVTIPVTNDMRDNAIGGMAGILKSHAADRGAPVDLIEPTTRPSEKLPHVTEYTWTWWTVDKLPSPQSASGGASYGYACKWDGVGLTPDGDIQVFGLGFLGIESAEELALEMLAAVHVARERMRDHAESQD
jgi:hypothetical protein